MNTIEALVLIAYTKILYFTLYNKEDLSGFLMHWDDFLNKIFYDQFDETIRKIAVARAVESEDLELYYEQVCGSCSSINYQLEDAKLTTYQQMVANQGLCCKTCGYKMPFIRQADLTKMLCLSQKVLNSNEDPVKEEECLRRMAEEKIYKKILRQIFGRPPNV